MSRCENPPYRGRLAPSPTGFLHLGHAATFLQAWERARLQKGTLLYREDDLDSARCRPEFSSAAVEDLRWLGIEWEQQGPLIRQSERLPLYRAALESLRTSGLIYPCRCSRKEVERALGAPHAGEDEPVYPGTCRPSAGAAMPAADLHVNWRFRVPAGETVSFTDLACGLQKAVAGADFGDFLVWRKDGFPSYQLASAVDDAEMGITEIVRGMDLIPSTFRQILLWRAMNRECPAFFHCPLVRGADGKRLAKREDACSLRTLREQGCSPADILRRLRQGAS